MRIAIRMDCTKVAQYCEIFGRRTSAVGRNGAEAIVRHTVHMMRLHGGDRCQ